MSSPFLTLTQPWLEFSQADCDRAWQQSQSLLAAGDRWTAYLNRLCVNTLLPWLQAEHCPDARAWPSAAALPSFWALTNGTAIALERSPATAATRPPRLVLVPTEAIDTDEFVVPQEWVDLPSWAGDYYLMVQIDPDAGGLRLSGYVSHAQLRSRSRYEDRDRTYCLLAADMISDLTVLWVSRQLCPAATVGEVDAATTRGLSPSQPLALLQANALIDRLGNPNILTPRLEVPFALWGALLEHGGWRQRLAERRQGLNESRSPWQWLRSGVSDIAQQFGWEQLTLQSSGARGESTGDGSTLLSRRLIIGGQAYDLQIRPLTTMAPTGETPSLAAPALEVSQAWRFELRSAQPGGQIPAGFKLRLLTEDLQAFDDNQDEAMTAVEMLLLEVAVDPGDGLVWEIEPMPEAGDREILRF